MPFFVFLTADTAVLRRFELLRRRRDSQRFLWPRVPLRGFLAVFCDHQGERDRAAEAFLVILYWQTRIKLGLSG